MGRYFIKFSYIGTNYRGLQKNVMPQTNVFMHDNDTIQGALQSAFCKIHPRCVNIPKITTSSRTDAGVHSFCNTGHIDLVTAKNDIYNPPYILRNVNQYLTRCQHTIRLLEFIPVKDDFHARIYAKHRTYVYRLMIPKSLNDHKIPISEMGHSYCFRSPTFDIEKVCKGVQLFLGKKNFKTFSSKSLGPVPVRYVRTLDRLVVEQGQPQMLSDTLTKNFDFWNVVCTGKGFLYQQVRRIVTALLSLGSGIITERDIKIMLQVPNHSNWNPHIPTVPGYGLYLINVHYDEKEINECIIKHEIFEDTVAFARPIVISKA